MAATLKLEQIGERGHEAALAAVSLAEQSMGLPASRPFSRRPWVAEITGPDDRHGLARRFLDGQTDYGEANSVGTRGVYVYFHLQEGRIYEVSYWTGWRSHERYFCVIHNGEPTRLDRAEVEEVFG